MSELFEGLERIDDMRTLEIAERWKQAIRTNAIENGVRPLLAAGLLCNVAAHLVGEAVVAGFDKDQALRYIASLEQVIHDQFQAYLRLNQEDAGHG